jgi:hypothetical protein
VQQREGIGEMSAVDLWVDFNELDEHNKLSSLAEFVSPGVKSLSIGTVISVGDYEGNRCEAEVLVVDDDLIEVALRGDVFHRADGSTCPISDWDFQDA